MRTIQELEKLALMALPSTSFTAAKVKPSATRQHEKAVKFRKRLTRKPKFVNASRLEKTAAESKVKTNISKKRKAYAVVAASSALSVLTPGFPIAAPIVATIAPKGYKAKATTESSIGGIVGTVPGTLAAAHHFVHADGRKGYVAFVREAKTGIKALASEISAPSTKRGRSRKSWITDRKALKALSSLKKSGLRGLGISTVGAAIGGTIGFAHATKEAYNSKLTKVAFHPESFTRNTPAQERRFVTSYNRKVVSSQAREPRSILGLATAGVAAYVAKKYHDRNPGSPLPLALGAIFATVAVKRWGAASKRERRLFVAEYNRAMGTTFTIEHPKMKAYWELTHARSSGKNQMSKYAGSYDPTLTRQKPGFDDDAEYKKNRNIPTSIALGRLLDEAVNRPPPPGIRKELKTTHTYGTVKVATVFDKIKQDYQYGKYLLGHKAGVYKHGRELDVSRGRLLKHDLSKFRPDEFRPYSNYWFGQKKNDPKIKAAFREAANKHYGRNEHHAYRVGIKPPTVGLALESIADWYTVSKHNHEIVSASPFPSIRSWYRQIRVGENMDQNIKLLADDHFGIV